MNILRLLLVIVIVGWQYDSEKEESCNQSVTGSMAAMHTYYYDVLNREPLVLIMFNIDLKT